ncbi:hypothetical protein GEV33_015265 [Tenebrio molitor]|uniref:Uncharacterized protein n=1 Tax=Tenebrio molitor TaxID=7067 RepID=A0A8J6H4E4_TENMO|nr:hypothetical protein GEV33_015269 [Tenebrio molitor]KAH0807526.1 hypothetical protein GEV33_015265 [Tenebrio molitor]
MKLELSDGMSNNSDFSNDSQNSQMSTADFMTSMGNGVLLTPTTTGETVRNVEDVGVVSQWNRGGTSGSSSWRLSQPSRTHRKRRPVSKVVELRCHDNVTFHEAVCGKQSRRPTFIGSLQTRF